MICESCGSEMQSSIEGSTLTWACPNCGNAVARTYIEPIRADATTYSLELADKGEPSKEAIRAVAGIAGCNYLAAKRLIEGGDGVLLSGNALNVKDAALKLSDVGLAYAVSPEFPYEIG